MQHSLVRLSLVAALAAAAPAQLPIRELVPADSRFVFALDLQAALDLVGRDLVRTGVARRARAAADGRLRADWDEVFEREWGFDPFTDLRGFLLFGDKGPHEEAAAALVTTDRIDATLARLLEAGALAPEERQGVEILQVVPGKALELFGFAGEEAARPVASLYVHRFGRGTDAGRALVVGAKADTVARAARALRAGDTLARTEGRLAEAMRAGDIAFADVSAAFADLAGEEPAARLTRKAQRCTLQLGTREDALELRLAVETVEPKDARQIAALLNGLKALLALAEPDEDVPPAALEALLDAQAEAADRTVTLVVRLPRELVDEALREVRRELQVDEEATPPPGGRRRRVVR